MWLHGAGGLETASVELAGKPVVVGRSGDLKLDDMIEKKHARFVLRDGKVLVSVLGKGDVWLGDQRISGETALAPGDMVLLSTSAAVFVAGDADQAPTALARASLKRLASFNRSERALVRLLEVPVPGLFTRVLDEVRKMPEDRIHAVASILKPVLERLAARPDAPPETQLAYLWAVLGSEKPAFKSAVLVAEEERARREAVDAAAPPPPPVDEEADPELLGGKTVPTRAWHTVPSEKNVGHGFSGGVPPIALTAWPRSPRDGAPMAHLGTVLVPAEYRVRGPEKVAIALFQADDHTQKEVEGAPRHEGDALVLEDEIGGTYAVIWLDAATFARGPGSEVRKGSEGSEVGEVPEGAKIEATAFLQLRARVGDPNVGKVIPGWYDDDDDDEEDEDGAAGKYVTPESPEGEALGLSRYSFHTSKALLHFGGTSVACDDYAEGLGPFYVGIEDGFGDANFGGGNAVLDLAREKIVFSS
ncbi:Hypothetical protein CAP_4831 [Chondromyces apiculatus DSM 436]|uniref:FHA domain-containing protein n=1 Tax=Chondromyces apiculatus DSM 436 TaxID=1192034 RepID=A0A017T4G8_9BACT|nr:Hypothetical protein CAP_4831 [Chondromyces apiculatus DSM 436]